MSTFEEIDDEIASLHMRIQDLKTRRNSLTSLCRLPADIIIHVLKLTQQNQPPKMDSFCGFLFPYRWTDVQSHYNAKWCGMMLVCTHLHSIALNARELWAHLDGSKNENVLDMFDRRASPLPLDIYVDNDFKAGTVPRVSRHLGNAGSVYINATGTRIPQWQEEFNRPKPSLKVFVFYGCEGAREYISIPDLGPKIFIRPDFLGGSNMTASLKTLVLTGVGFEQAPSFPNLQYLQLEVVTLSPTMHELSDFVQNAPMLETLLVNYTLSRDGPESAPAYDTTRSASHPTLKTLMIRNSVENIRTLLRVLPLPSFGLSVQVMTVGWESSIHFPISSVHFDIYIATACFWHNVTGSDELPNGVLTSEYRTGNHGTQQPTTQTWLEFKSEEICYERSRHPSLPWVHLTMRCVLQSLNEVPFAIPCLRLIKHKKISLFGLVRKLRRDQPPTDPPIWQHATHLIGFKHIVIAGEDDESDIGTVRSWMQQCTQAGCEVENLELKDCGIALHRMAAQLENEGIVRHTLMHNTKGT